MLRRPFLSRHLDAPVDPMGALFAGDLFLNTGGSFSLGADWSWGGEASFSFDTSEGAEASASSTTNTTQTAPPPPPSPPPPPTVKGSMSPANKRRITPALRPQYQRFSPTHNLPVTFPSLYFDQQNGNGSGPNWLLIGGVVAAASVAAYLILRKKPSSPVKPNPRRGRRLPDEPSHTVSLGHDALKVFQRYWWGQSDPLYAMLSRRGNSVDVITLDVSDEELGRFISVAQEIMRESDDPSEVRVAQKYIKLYGIHRWTI